MGIPPRISMLAGSQCHIASTLNKTIIVIGIFLKYFMQLFFKQAYFLNRVKQVEIDTMARFYD